MQSVRGSQLSVIIPAFNAGRYIEECLRSVIYQGQCPVFEVIVVDDGSTDNTYDVVRAGFPNVRLFRQKNGGPGAARNLGAANSQSPVLVFQDADDIMLPGRLAVQGQYMLDNPNVLLSVGNYKYQLKPDFDRNGTLGVASGEHFSLVRNAYQKLMCGANFVATGVAAVQHQAYREVGGIREDVKVAEDHALALTLARRGSIAATRRFLTWYRQDQSNNLMKSNHTYSGPVIVLREELLTHRDELTPGEYAAAFKRWCHLANVLLRYRWIEHGRAATWRELKLLKPLLPRRLVWKWRTLAMLPAAVGRWLRGAKRLSGSLARNIL